MLVAPGDQVEAEQSIIVLESDKATMEIPSPVAGTIGFSPLACSQPHRAAKASVAVKTPG